MQNVIDYNQLQPATVGHARITARSRFVIARSKAKGAIASVPDACVDLSGLDDAVGYLLRRAQLAVFADLIDTLAELELRPGTLAVLIVIGRNPGLTQSEVSAVLGIKRTNFVAVVNELESRGWVVRCVSPADRRVNALELSPEGRQILKRALALQAKHEERLASRLGEHGRSQLLAGLRSLITEGETSRQSQVPTASRSGRRTRG